MDPATLLIQARQAAELSQGAMAAAAGTARPNLSAYEHGRISPTLTVASRILDAAGYELSITPKIEFHEGGTYRGLPIEIPNVLPRLPPETALATVVLPLLLNWSDTGRSFDMRRRRDRAWVYEIVLREGTPEDVLTYIDGALLVDLWDELVLPVAIREAWNPLVTATGTNRRVA
ncbi:helix-turn-helix domain-containing protein [Actinocatenispora sera]|uniref:helix-turn-helix domain-containing protein n=1 Tax=Actinocatenispora sera TaxID=390989 RepID=UPI0033FBC303